VTGLGHRNDSVERSPHGAQWPSSSEGHLQAAEPPVSASVRVGRERALADRGAREARMSMTVAVRPDVAGDGNGARPATGVA
jgi:hypothetical protein